MQRVERTLKDLIEFGFAENVEEELLEFDEQGNLVKVTAGGRTRDGIAVSDIAGSIGGAPRSGMGDDADDYGSVSSSALNDDSSSYLGG